MSRRFSIGCVSALCVFTACLPKQEFPITPKIELMGVALNPLIQSPVDSIGIVRFSFTDGDGDLGLNPVDTIGEFAPGKPYYYNLFIHYFERQGGQYVEIQPPLPFHSRFRSLTPVGKDKTLQGEMSVGVFARPMSTTDSVRYRIYIVDRAMRHSDTIDTGPLPYPF